MKTGYMLKQIIEQKGIKKSWLAEKMGISDSTLSSKLKSEMRVLDVIKICELLDIDFDEFFKQCKKNY